jgi:3-dehydroquinate synthase
MNQPLTITTPTATYDILVGAGLLATLPERLHELGLRGALWLISDNVVYPLYGAALEEQLRGAGFRIQSYQVPSGETSKDLHVAGQLYDWLLGGSVERRDTVLALGGGVVGDLAGFVAATVLRGINVVQLPTNLQSMVDSAIGGKTGVNHARGKNLIGAFHQPRLVLSDTDTLATLPPRELSAGWAEAIKHGVIRDAGLFQLLEDERRKTKDEGALLSSSVLRPSSAQLIRRAVKVKVDVVNADERETGERMLLNYGHTLGHAIEAAAGYGTLLHGEAVAIGMDLEAQIAQRLGMVDAALVERQRALLQAYGLPTSVPPTMNADDLLARTLRDKKVSAGRVRWALPTAIGTAIIRDDVPEEVVRAVVEAALVVHEDRRG